MVHKWVTLKVKAIHKCAANYRGAHTVGKIKENINIPLETNGIILLAVF